MKQDLHLGHLPKSYFCIIRPDVVKSSLDNLRSRGMRILNSNSTRYSRLIKTHSDCGVDLISK